MSDQVPDSPKSTPRIGLIHRANSRKGMAILALVSLFLLLAAIGGVMYYSSKRSSSPAPMATPPSLNELATEFPEISQILQDEKLASVYKEFLMAYQQGGQEAAYELAKNAVS